MASALNHPEMDGARYEDYAAALPRKKLNLEYPP